MRKVLLNPGPATTTLKVKNSQIVSDICPREKEFQKIINSVRDDLVKIAGGDDNYTCILFGGSGTAAMEACMCSVINEEKGAGNIHDYATIISNGAYGDRFTTIATSHSIETLTIKYPYGDKITYKRIKKHCENVPNTGGVFITHHETTTGILNNIKKVGEIIDDENYPYIVDTISSFAGIPLSVKDIKADFIMSTSNKCLQGLPGVAFVIAKKESLEKCKQNFRSVYLDLYRQWKYLEEKGQFQFTPPVQSIYALREAIDELFEEGLENRFRRYRNNHHVLTMGMKNRGFKLFLNHKKVCPSGLLETYYEPEHCNWNFDVFHDKLYERGFTIYPGKTNQKTFRLANIGAIDIEDIRLFLDNVDIVLNEMGVSL